MVRSGARAFARGRNGLRAGAWLAVVGLGLPGAAWGAVKSGRTTVEVEVIPPPPGTVLSPEEKAAAVQRHVLAVDGMDPSQVRLTVQDGVVLMQGFVPTLGARRRAVQAARQVRGVRAVVERLVLRTSERPDEEILADVTARLEAHPLLPRPLPTVHVEDGTVVLDGLVEDFGTEQLTGLIAADVPGARRVLNRTLANHDAPRQRSDEEIRKAVLRRFWTDPFLRGAPIEVQVQGAHVYLSGRVGNEKEKSAAHITAWVPGVEDIHDENLQVDFNVADRTLKRREEMYKNPHAIRDALRTAWRMDPRIGPRVPDIQVKKGMVVLTGRVSTELARRAVGEDAEHVVGVYAVSNLVEVTPNPVLTDGELRVLAEEALLHHPLLAPRGIQVEFFNGSATLTGTVQDARERRMAAQTLRSLRGVRDIRNQLALPGEGASGTAVTTIVPLLPPE